jgi:hypothetical protein
MVPVPADRGTQLAEQRTRLAVRRSFLAAERTLMAWVRTSLSMISFGCYAFGPRLGGHGAEGVWARRRWVSVAAGVSVASRERRHEAATAGAADPVYWLHLGGFAAYSALIGYLLVERAARGPLALAVYGLAMALHFLIVDHSLREEHGRVYDHGGHWVLAASVLVGWIAGATTPLSEVVFARLFAVLAGGVVITSLKAELPREREGRFWPFCLGAAAYAVLLVLA